MFSGPPFAEHNVDHPQNALLYVVGLPAAELRKFNKNDFRVGGRHHQDFVAAAVFVAEPMKR